MPPDIDARDAAHVNLGWAAAALDYRARSLYACVRNLRRFAYIYATIKSEIEAKWSFLKVSLFIFKIYKFLEKMIHANPSDINIVQDAYIFINHCNPNHFLVQILRRPLQSMYVDSNL